MSYPNVTGRAVEGVPYREAQSCLTPAFSNSSYKFFLANTTTPANVYQNGALTTPFPITGIVASDSFGRFPPIYLDTSVIYKVQFFDSTNTLRWTANPYVAPLATVGTSSLSAFGMIIATTGEVTVPAPNTGGSGVSLTLKAGALGTTPLQISATLPGNSALIVNSSATTGAQTATFTATNKPGTATSSPGGWLPITCDGVQYYAPLWHGNNFSPYVANPSALGEVISASSVLFGGNGLTTATGGTATPSNWFSPVSANIGAGYYINITKTSGLSGLAFSAAQGAWTNITSGGLTVSSNAQAAITGTYQISNSVSGSPVVAAGTITLSNNNGVQSPTYNGATPIVLAGNGTATLNGAGTSNWYAPTTASIGAGFYILITPTGGTAGYSFSAGTGAYTNITSGGLTIGVTGTGAATFSVSGTYIIASDAGGVNQLGTGTITLTGSNVQSPNWSGTTPLNLAGNGSATLNGVSTSSWFSPNSANVGSSFWINLARTSGTSGVNFSAAQGAWTNITNSGLSIGLSGYTGDVGTVNASGTWQISNSSSGTPVLGSGTISLSLAGLTVTRTYTSGTGATEIVPTGATRLEIILDGSGASGADVATVGTGGGGGGAGEAHSTNIVVSGGQTLTYTIGAPGAGVGAGSNGNPSGASSVVGNGGLSAVSLSVGAAGAGLINGTGGAGSSGSGGNSANLTGGNGATGAAGGTGGSSAAGASGGNFATPPGTPGGGSGGAHSTPTSAGGAGQVVFKYT